MIYMLFYIHQMKKNHIRDFKNLNVGGKNILFVFMTFSEINEKIPISVGKGNKIEKKKQKAAVNKKELKQHVTSGRKTSTGNKAESY